MENVLFKVHMSFGLNYPFEPPNVTFIDTVFTRSNVTSKRVVCLPLLEIGNWKPIITIDQILIAVQDILMESNVEEVAQVHRQLNVVEYRFGWETLQMWCHTFLTTLVYIKAAMENLRLNEQSISRVPNEIASEIMNDGR